jgi:beta-lactamase class A
MKHIPVAYYSARHGVYYERRLRKSTQFVFGAYLLVFGIAVLLAGPSIKPRLSHIVASMHHAPTQSRLVAHTDKAALSSAPKVALHQPKLPDPQSEAGRLATAVATALEQNPASNWSVSVYDIQAKTWLLRSNSQQQITSASLYKLYAAYGLAEKVPFSQWATTQLPGQTDGQNLQTCVDLMLRVSDNACGDMIGDFVGWKTIDTYLHAAGFSGTVLNQRSGPVTTADDTTRFMASLYQGKLVDPAATAFLLDSLHHQLYRAAIPAGCQDCSTYNKTGNESGVAHDSAVIFSGGRKYAVTIMSQNGGSYAKIAEVERAIQSVLVPKAL